VPGIEVSMAVAAPVAIVVGAAVVVAGRLAMQTRRAPSTTTGRSMFIGELLTVQQAAGMRGQAFAHGAWWNVRSADEPLEQNEAVRVVDVDGLDLVVTRATGSPDHPQTGAP
jgi:membrane-bound serine protease (ClpP class)